MTSPSPKVLAVVVTYHPEPALLQRLLQSLTLQVDTLLIVDNTPDNGDAIMGILAPLRDEMPGIRVERRGYNLGIAVAQNIGIRLAMAEGFEYVLLSDQDSMPSPSMVNALRECCEELQVQGVSVGCVCPEYYDETTGQVFRFQVQLPGRLFYSSVPGNPEKPWMEIIIAISSGTLIPLAALEAVGGMLDEFFIDDVDSEWCLRARAKGFRNFGTCRARLTHRLGDESFRVWYFGWREHTEYSPSRLYYRFRNFVLLCRLPHVPVRWSVRASWYWLGNVYAHCCFARNRFANMRAIAWGLWDGILGRTGPLRRSI